MLGLFYPAVLGTLFYSFLPLLQNFENIRDNRSAFVIFIALLLHFCVDYFYTQMTERYSVFNFTADLILLYLIYLASQAVNYADGGVTDVRRVSFCMAGVYGIFLVWDVNARLREPYFRGLVTFEIIALCSFVTCGAMSAKTSPIVVVVVILSCTILLLYFGRRAWSLMKEDRRTGRTKGARVREISSGRL
jgi:membrane-bound metal-dependent hydrolase YbcI (DUF457 family)